MTSLGPKVNLYRILRQLQTIENQYAFLREHKLLPETINCPNCQTNLHQVYPINNPGAKFKFFRCSCSSNVKIPITKETFLYDSNRTISQYVILLYGFCKQWKYNTTREEADVEGPDCPTQPGYTKKKLSNKTIASWLEVFCICVGQEMTAKEMDHKIGGVGCEVEIDES